MSIYTSTHVCMPKPDHIRVERGGDRSASIEFRHGDEHVKLRRSDVRACITFGVENRASVSRLIAACEEALALLDEIEREEAAQTTLEVAS